MVAVLNKPPSVDEYESTKPPSIQEYEYEPPEPQRISVWEPTLKERIRNAISGMAQRSPFVQQGKRLGQLGLHHLSEAVSGLGLYIPDVLVSKITEQDTLASAVDKITGFEPTPRDIRAGEAAKFITSLKSVGRVLGPIVSRIPVRQSLRIILGSGLDFGGRQATEELAKKISTGKPIDVEGIHFESGIGIAFGAGVVGVSKFLQFIKGLRALPKAQLRPARAEANRAWKHYQKTGDRTSWDAVRIKYAGIKPEGVSRIKARQAPPTVEEFGKYPLGKPIKTPPTIGKLAPRKPTEAITKPKAVEVAPEALPDIEEIIKLTPESPELKKVIADISKQVDVAFRQNDLDAMQKIVPLTWELPSTPETGALVRRVQILDGEMLARARERQAQPPTLAKAEPTKVVGKKTLVEIKKETPAERKYFTDLLLDERKRIIDEAKGFIDQFGPDILVQDFQPRLSEIDKDLRRRGYNPTNLPKLRPELEKAIAEGWVPVKTKEKLKAEEVKPKGKPGFVDVRPLLKVHKTFMGIVEPSKAVEIKLGKEPYAAVIKGIHQTDVGRIEFNEAQIEGQDKSLGQLSKWFNKFSDRELKFFMLSRGEPTTENARLIQRSAREKLPKDLRRSDLFNAVQRIADSNYKYLQSIVGDDVHRVEDYFYGIYKNPKQVDKFLDYWRTTKRFTKEKKLPTVADAIDYGLELRNYNPIENLKAEYIAISHLEGMNWLRDELLRTGKGKFIDDMLEAPLDWDMVHDPIFKELRLQPNLAKLINNLIATNKITRIPLANTLREINNVTRTIKFIGSAFHLLSVAKQSIADSGYLGFLYKPTATRGFTGGFRANDPIFRTTAYKDYIRHGGGHRYSVESEARRAFNRAVNELNRNMGIAVKVGALPLKIPTGFVNWMFQSYIPKVKYAKFLDVVAEQEKKLGRKLTSPEKIDIIKEQQNFYGMMNERLFGRSGTVTSATRFYFMSPGYAEGNYRTMLKAATQWGGKGGFKANRSRSNIINSWLITATAATVGTLIFTGKPPKKLEILDDARDLFKIDTGKKDEKGRQIMIDLMTYDKDYWNVAFNTLRLRPDVAIGKSWKRIGGMKAPTAEIIVDLALMSMGKAIYDWKGDRVVEITDPFLLKAMKLTTHEIKNLVPISVSVFQQSKKRDIDTTVAAIETLLGFRPTKTEKDLREQKIISKMYSLRGQREELSWYIGQSTDPKRMVERYNKTVNDILDNPYVPKAMKDEWGPRLLIEYDKVVTWKRFPAGKMTNAELGRAYDAHTLSIPYKRRGEPYRGIGEPKKGSERRVTELKAEAKKRGIILRRSPRKPPR